MTVSSISAVIVCHNEALNIRHCLESLKGRCEIFVVDSGSTDATLELCREYTDNIHQHAYENHARQWQWSLENLPIRTGWVLALDADFVVTPELWQRIECELSQIPDSVAGIYVRHRYRFAGGLIRFGGTKKYWLRIVRVGRAYADTSELVDFRFAVDGDTIRWREAVIEYNRNDADISTWLAKQDKFAARLAVEEELRRRKLQSWSLRPSPFGNSDARFAWLRDVWLRMPLFLRPALYFLYRYGLALGFLDGRAGFLYHALQGFWLRIVVDWKTAELRGLDLDDEALRSFAEYALQHRLGSVRDLERGWRQREAQSP